MCGRMQLIALQQMYTLTVTCTIKYQVSRAFLNSDFNI